MEKSQDAPEVVWVSESCFSDFTLDTYYVETWLRILMTLVTMVTMMAIVSHYHYDHDDSEEPDENCDQCWPWPWWPRPWPSLFSRSIFSDKIYLMIKCILWSKLSSGKPVKYLKVERTYLFINVFLWHFACGDVFSCPQTAQ